MANGQASIARVIAYDAFIRVMDEGESPEAATEALYAEHKGRLKRLDRNFVKEILYGGLRWHSKIFWILQNTSKRDLRETTPEIRTALILGTYQIFYMDRVPDRAAVNESVEYVRGKGQANAVKFINGILRQIARRSAYFTKPDKQAQPVQYLALQFAHPEWIVDRWLKHFRFDKMEGMLAANNQPPPWTIRINQMKTERAKLHEFQSELLRQEKVHSERRTLRGAVRLKGAPNLEADSLFAQGFYTIQDEASQLIGLLVDPQADDTIWEACAGPGGKLTHIYELCQGEATIVGIEKSTDQLEKAKATAQRLGHEKITWVQQDFLEFKGEGQPTKILLDAPCSGLGVLRRHPEGKWQKQLDLVKTMAALQKKLIDHAWDLLPVDGELIYSVCSFEPEESEKHLERLINQHGDSLEVVSPVARLPDYHKRYVTRKNLLAIYAGNQDDMDGFGAFIVRKRG